MARFTVHEGLAIVKLDGYKPRPEMVTDEDGNEVDVSGIAIDLPGSANWLCEQYGMSDEKLDGPGILWTDYDSSSNEPWAFSVLIASDEAEGFTEMAREAGYSIDGIEEVAEPMVYGDGSGTCEILRHRDGWVVLEN